VSTPLLEARGLTRTFRSRGRVVAALDGVDLAIAPGESVGLVGASGSGKTTLARVLLRLIEPDAGTVRFEGEDLLALRGATLRRARARLQMVFQDPLAAFNPRATVGRVIDDPLRVHGVPDRAKRIATLLDRVGLAPGLAARAVHEISGGQRQRVAIARAIATAPSLIVLDEPVSALDVSVRAQILKLLVDLQAETGVAYLFVSHDLGVVRAVTRRVVVMEAGRVVETGGTEAVLAHPQSAATIALVAAVPRLDRRAPSPAQETAP